MLSKVSYNAYAASANSIQSRPTKSVNFGMDYEKGSVNLAAEIVNIVRQTMNLAPDGLGKAEALTRGIPILMHHIAAHFKSAQFEPETVGRIIERTADEIAATGRIPTMGEIKIT